ncbi:type II toxin-antitoxin system HicB family antitoxin [Spirosoma foliorum]|uniref:2-oxoisovalerate dehydrogenase E1 subunit beta n=1 Tax=Spirosoma foliorum TaxID=2710596 RepID=A0A7G5GV59_9BACT|nr:2-oxoisovalerate dehydrogenase E1 subunit beta [Spirosoma foliorum]QMW02751.1 2-oxoisovalerate dehydrogenase E1 subunit beta [Spirosoma foliorum]
MSELVFQVEPDEEGGYVARAKLATGSIITQGDTLDELKAMIKDAVSGYFYDRPDKLPKTIRLQVNEVFALA